MAKMLNIVKLAKALLKLASVNTEEGVELVYNGELEVGVEVFVEQDGEMVSAPDGVYNADGYVYTVADGKISEIVEKEPESEEETGNTENSDETVDLSKEAFNAQKLKFEATYQEIVNNIYKAIANTGLYDFYIVENTDSYAIVSVYETGSEILYKYPITVNDNGEVETGERVKVEVVYQEEGTEEGTENEELAALRKENEELKLKLNESLALSAEEEAKKLEQKKTGGFYSCLYK